MQDMRYPSNFTIWYKKGSISVLLFLVHPIDAENSLCYINSTLLRDWIAEKKPIHIVCVICQKNCPSSRGRNSLQTATKQNFFSLKWPTFKKPFNFISHLTRWRHTLLAMTTLPASQLQSPAILSYPGDQPGICTCSTRVEQPCHNQNLCF